MDELEVVREDPSGRIVKWPWHNPELPEGALLPPLHYHEAIGVVVARFNGLELYFRHLVGQCAGLASKRIEPLLLHVSSTALEQSLTTLANETVQHAAVRDELMFCVKLFKLCRENRNFLVHSATEVSPLALSWTGPGMLLTKRTARGKRQIDHYRLAVETIRRVADEIHDATSYFSAAIGPLSHVSGTEKLVLPHRPTLPDELRNVSPKVNLMEEISRQLSASRKEE